MKAKKGQAGLAALLLFFIGAIVVLSILPEIADTTQKMRYTIPVVNETINYATARFDDQTINVNKTFVLTNAPTSSDWRGSDGSMSCGITSFSLLNGAGSALTLTTDYLFDGTNGTLNLVNNTATQQDNASNLTYGSYNYCDEGYVVGSAGRSMVSLILIFSALGLLGFAIYYGVKQWIR